MKYSFIGIEHNVKNETLKWTDEYIQGLKIKAKAFEGYIIYSLYCTALDEISRLSKENELDYNDMRNFQEKFIKADSLLRSIKNDLEDYV